ncbi:MAG TPA: hypothetical protein VD999_00400 [Vitreimonas sp.]|nr:hypothetical protein [Vitreimonas sp.]
MQKIKTFFITFFKSLTQPSYYNDVLAAPSSFSWKYFLVLHLLLSLFVTALIMIPVAAFDAISAINQSFSVYPSDLEVKVADQRIDINQPLPYSIPFPAEWTEEMDEDIKKDIDVEDIPLNEAEDMNLVTFVEDGTIASNQDFYAHNSLAVVSPTTMYFLKDVDTGEVRSYPVPETEQPLLINGTMIDELQNKIVNFPAIKQKWYVPALGLFLLVFMYPTIVVWRMLTIFVYSIVVYFAAAWFMRAKQLTFGEVYKLGLHAITSVIVVTLVAEYAANYSIGGWSYFFLYAIWMVVIMTQVRNTATLKPVATHTEPTRTTHKKAVTKTTKKSK